MRLLGAAEPKLAPHPHSRHGLHNAAYESSTARPCQPGPEKKQGQKNPNSFVCGGEACLPPALLSQHLQHSHTASPGEGGKEQRRAISKGKGLSTTAGL